MLAYECNFTTSCSSQNCTAANYGGIILFELVRGLANGDIKEEILSMLDQISLEDAITIVSKRKSEEIEAANARMPNKMSVSEIHPENPRGVQRLSPHVTWPSVVTPRRRCCPTRTPGPSGDRDTTCRGHHTWGPPCQLYRGHTAHKHQPAPLIRYSSSRVLPGLGCCGGICPGEGYAQDDGPPHTGNLFG